MRCRLWGAALLAAVSVLAAGCARQAVIQWPADPAALQFRKVHAQTPAPVTDPAAPAPAPNGPEATTMQEVIDKVGDEAMALGMSLPAPPTDPGIIERLEVFGTLTAAEVALLPEFVRFNVPSIGCAQLAGGPLGHPDPDLDTVVCDSPADPAATVKYYVESAALDGSALAGVGVERDEQNPGSYRVLLEFTPDGAAAWAELTAANVQGQVAMVLGDEVLMAPTIQEAITGGSAELVGMFTAEEATEIGARLEAAATG